MAELTFYTNPMSRGRVVRWVLEEIGQPYDTEIMDYADTIKGEAYLRVNPMGKVPAIEHKGKVVTEVAAICAYLADAFPAAGLAPPPTGRADYYRWLFFAAAPVEQAIINHHMKFVPSPEQSRMAGYGSYETLVAVLDGMLQRVDQFVTGDQFTAADVYVGSQLGWGTRFGLLPQQPSFMRYLERVTARPAYARAAAIDDALIAATQPQPA